MADADLNFIARQIERLIGDVATMRDEQRVQSAMIMRLDNSYARLDGGYFALLEEMRAIHGQVAS
jgi:hypothetical protein